MRFAECLRFNFLDGLFCAFIIWHGGRCIMENPYFNSRTFIQAAGCLLIYFCGRCIHSKSFFFHLLFIAGIGQAIWGILQWKGILPSYHISFATCGSFSNPSLWGICCVCGLLAGMPLFNIYRSTLYRIVWLAGCALLVTAITLAFSRSAWVALASGICLHSWTSREAKSIKTRLCSYRLSTKIKCLFFGVAALAIGLAAYGLYYLRPESVQGRFLIWQVIAERIPEAFLCGHGALQACYMPMQAAWFAVHPNAPTTLFAGENVYAFNEFLRIAFESGLIGLTLFTGMLIIAFRKVSHTNPASRYAGNILLAIICFGCFSYPLSSASITAIAIFSLAVMAKGFPATEWQFPLPGRWIPICIGGAFLIYATTEYAITKGADLFLQNAQHNPAILEKPQAKRYAYHLQGNPDFMLVYGKTLYNHGCYADALPILQQASRLKPSSRLWCDLGDCYRHQGNLVAAEKAYRLAADMIPSRILPHYRLFCLYRDHGDKEKATEEANHMLDMQVKVVNTSVLRYRHQAKQFLNQH